MAEDELHPVQRAFLWSKHRNAVTVLTEWSSPQQRCCGKLLIRSDRQIREALDGNLCRCGSHPRILRAVRRAEVLLYGVED